jgi:hypothetical protein
MRESRRTLARTSASEEEMGKLCSTEAKEGSGVSTAAFNKEGVKDGDSRWWLERVFTGSYFLLQIGLAESKSPSSQNWPLCGIAVPPSQRGTS